MNRMIVPFDNGVASVFPAHQKVPVDRKQSLGPLGRKIEPYVGDGSAKALETVVYATTLVALLIFTYSSLQSRIQDSESLNAMEPSNKDGKNFLQSPSRSESAPLQTFCGLVEFVQKHPKSFWTTALVATGVAAYFGANKAMYAFGRKYNLLQYVSVMHQKDITLPDVINKDQDLGTIPADLSYEKTPSTADLKAKEGEGQTPAQPTSNCKRKRTLAERKSDTLRELEEFREAKANEYGFNDHERQLQKDKGFYKALEARNLRLAETEASQTS